jgi:hypothetical protein
METEIEWKKLSKKQKARIVGKGVVMIVGAVGAGTVVTLGIKNTIPLGGLNRFNKVMVVIGSSLLAGAAGDIAGEQAAGIFESSVTPIEKGFEALKALKSMPSQKAKIVVVDL